MAQPKSLAQQIAAAEAKAKRESLEKLFEQHLKAAGIAEGFVSEHLFHPDRKWRIDFAIPSKKLAIEIEGGTWVNGGHNRGGIYEDNCNKYNELARMGWTLFRFTTGMVKSGKALMFVEDYLKVNQ